MFSRKYKNLVPELLRTSYFTAGYFRKVFARAHDICTRDNLFSRLLRFAHKDILILVLYNNKFHKYAKSAFLRCGTIYLHSPVRKYKCDKRTRVTRNPAPKGATLRHTLSHPVKQSHTVEDILYLLT